RAFGDTDSATRLVGYIRPADPTDPPTARQLQLHVARSAPAYMLPAQFVVLTEFPRTPNGTLNRSMLPVPAQRSAAAGPAGDGPGASMIDRIAKIVAEVLERPAVDPYEDFFSLGGDSLRAVQIVLRLNDELETEVPINALFETRTVFGLAAL